MPINSFCDCSNSYGSLVQCGSCGVINKRQIEKQIQNQVGVYESQITDIKGTINIGNELIKSTKHIKLWNNLSDRSAPSKQPNNVSSRGNSVTRSITSNRPGSMVPGGVGVDVKHGSYARYLGKLKAPIISKTDEQTPPNIIESRLRPAVNNKQYRFSLVSNNINCNC